MRTLTIAAAIVSLGAMTARAADYTVTTDTIDAGGGQSASADYSATTGIGGIAGISTDISTSETAKQCYLGQLTEVASVGVTGTPAPVNETATSQLAGIASLDDDTVASLTGSDVNWNPPAFPFASINSNGVATFSAVYTNTPGSFSGRYLGVLGTGSLVVLDSDPDNFGSYASDGLPDWWQAQYFGLDNADAAPVADPDGDGQDNNFEYVAGVVPTNAASLFVLRIVEVPGQPDQQNLIFSPRLPDRTYTPQFRSDLLAGTWTTLTDIATSDDGDDRTVTDLSAVEPVKFYRIQITPP